jgi:hypothetical protein
MHLLSLNRLSFIDRLLCPVSYANKPAEYDI